MGGGLRLRYDPPLAPLAQARDLSHPLPPKMAATRAVSRLPSVVDSRPPLPVACADLAFFNLPFISRPRPSEIGFDVGPALRGGNRGFLRPGLDSAHCPQPGRAQRSPSHQGQTPRVTSADKARTVGPDLQANGRPAAWTLK